MKHNLGFADFALASSLEHNRSITLIENIYDAIDWASIDSVLMSQYTVDISGCFEGCRRIRQKCAPSSEISRDGHIFITLSCGSLLLLVK